MKRDAIKEAKPQAESASILVIGYGNPYRRDDGAGPVLAEKLAHCWLTQGISARALTPMQLTPELAAEIGDAEVHAVVFIDTSINSAGSTLQISQIDVDSPSPSLGHQLEPPTLLVYAALLYWRCPPAWLVTVPGVDFDHGQGFSPEVQALLDDVTPLADQLLSKMKVCVPCMN